MASITLYELGAYNNGTLTPHTFDLDNLDSQDAWREAVQDWLWRLTKETGQLCEEWIVADYEDMPGEFVGTWDIDPAYWAYKQALEDSHLDAEVFAAGVELGISPEMVEELYQGDYASDEDFAYQLADDLGVLPKDFQWPTSYIDWGAAARDLMMDYGSAGGHYFRTSY